jgi:hypothetical protein
MIRSIVEILDRRSGCDSRHVIMGREKPTGSDDFFGAHRENAKERLDISNAAM